MLNVAKKAGSWERAREVLEALKQDVDEKLAILLTKEQQKRLKGLSESSDQWLIGP